VYDKSRQTSKPRTMRTLTKTKILRNIPTACIYISDINLHFRSLIWYVGHHYGYHYYDKTYLSFQNMYDRIFVFVSFIERHLRNDNWVRIYISRGLIDKHVIRIDCVPIILPLPNGVSLYSYFITPSQWCFIVFLLYYPFPIVFHCIPILLPLPNGVSLYSYFITPSQWCFIVFLLYYPFPILFHSVPILNTMKHHWEGVIK
jgi:hypothetical protein